MSPLKPLDYVIHLISTLSVIAAGLVWLSSGAVPPAVWVLVGIAVVTSAIGAIRVVRAGRERA